MKLTEDLVCGKLVPELVGPKPYIIECTFNCFGYGTIT